MILLRATARADEDDSDDDEDDRRLCGVSVPGELGAESMLCESSLRSRQTNCTSPVSEIFVQHMDDGSCATQKTYLHCRARLLTRPTDLWAHMKLRVVAGRTVLQGNEFGHRSQRSPWL